MEKKEKKKKNFDIFIRDWWKTNSYFLEKLKMCRPLFELCFVWLCGRWISKSRRHLGISWDFSLNLWNVMWNPYIPWNSLNWLIRSFFISIYYDFLRTIYFYYFLFNFLIVHLLLWCTVCVRVKVGLFFLFILKKYVLFFFFFFCLVLHLWIIGIHLFFFSLYLNWHLFMHKVLGGLGEKGFKMRD